MAGSRLAWDKILASVFLTEGRLQAGGCHF
jgi:hypothetical protein